MTTALIIVAILAIPVAAGWVLSLVDPPEPPPERLVNRLWASRSLWRESK